MTTQQGRVTGYLAAVVATCVATAATFAVRRWIGPSGSLLFFPGIVFLAMNWGYGPALAGTVLSSASLSYFFVPPTYSFNIGIDDFLRLMAFAAVAIATASAASARRSAEAALRRSVDDLQRANAVLRRVAEWPQLFGGDAFDLVREVFGYAAHIVGVSQVVAVWEVEDEPWVYVAAPSQIEVITRHEPGTRRSPTIPTNPSGQFEGEFSALNGRMDAALGLPLPGDNVRVVPFRTEHLRGRVFFVGVNESTEGIMPLTELVAREVSTSLDQLHLADQMRVLAVHEERIRLARDLHDGILQSLTGIRLQLQNLANAPPDGGLTNSGLLGLERVLANQQRELRMFIEDIRSEKPPAADAGDLALTLDELHRRLALEWRTPIAIRLTPSEVRLPAGTCRNLGFMIHEAVINALKHGQPSQVTVEVVAHAQQPLRIMVTNDGRGFPFVGRLEHEALVRSAGGPLSLRDRVIALGGRMTIESEARGARVEMLLPRGESLAPAVQALTAVRAHDPHLRLHDVRG